MLSIDLVSGGLGGSAGNGASENIALSGDGRLAVFSSLATNLISGDTNGCRDVFLRDMQTGVTTRISTNSAAAQANGDSRDPRISADGRYVTFASNATNLVGDDTNGVYDVFVKDLQTGATRRVSTDNSNSQANNASDYPAISDDGRYVTFRSSASNLVSGDTNASDDIFVKDLQTSVVVRVSTASTGAEADGASDSPSISGNGRYIAFRSSSDNLLGAGVDVNLSDDIFVRDLQTGVTTCVSTDSYGAWADGHSYAVAISGDGRYVAFSSDADNLVDGDTNGNCDIFVKDLQTNVTLRVSTDSASMQVSGLSDFPAISGDGRYVVFQSWAGSLVAVDGNRCPDIFIKDLQTGTAARISTDATGAQADGWSYDPAISSDGQRIAFSSDASNLIRGDGNEARDVFRSTNPLIEIIPTGVSTPKVNVTNSVGTYNGEGFGGSVTLTGVSGIATLTLEGVGATLLYYVGAGTAGVASTSAPLTAGTYTVVGVFAGSPHYTAAQSVPLTFVIAKATPMLNIEDASGVYTGSAFTASSGIVGIGGVLATNLEGVSPTVTYYVGAKVGRKGSTSAPTNAGTYTVVASFAGSANYRAVQSGPVTFAIRLATPTLTVGDVGGTYNSSAFPATLKLLDSHGIMVSNLEGIRPTLTYYVGVNASGRGSSTAPSAAGTYTVVASFKGSVNFAAVRSSPVTFRIAKATASLTVSAPGGTYNGSPLTATVNLRDQFGDWVSSIEGIRPQVTYYYGETAGGAVVMGLPKQAGKYTVVASFKGSRNYAAISSVPVTFTIARAAPVVTVNVITRNSSSASYRVTAQLVGVRGSWVSGLEGVKPVLTYYAGIGVNGAGSATAPTDHGMYTVVATFPGSLNYAVVDSTPLTFILG